MEGLERTAYVALLFIAAVLFVAAWALFVVGDATTATWLCANACFCLVAAVWLYL